MLNERPRQHKINMGFQQIEPVQHNDSERQRIFVDFHNADAQGRLRLNCVGTIEDLAAQKIEFQAGQYLVLYSEDLEVNGIVEYSQSEHLWVVVIDWDEIKEVEENSGTSLKRDSIQGRSSGLWSFEGSSVSG